MFNKHKSIWVGV